MSGHSILYLGQGATNHDFLAELETSRCCTMLGRAHDLQFAAQPHAGFDVVLLDVGQDRIASHMHISTIMETLSAFPVVALTDRAREHAGIAAVRAGAQASLCVDNTSPDAIMQTLTHAVERFRLQQAMSQSDKSVLSIFSSINDGAMVVNSDGHVLEINPAARSILGLSARELPADHWTASFCGRDEYGEPYASAFDLPLARVQRGEKFSNQVCTYQVSEEPETLLSINGQGLYNEQHQLIGGVITFRDITDSRRQRQALQKRAQYDELTGMPNRGMFSENLTRAIGRAERKASPLAVLFIDLDRFKSVNDTLGHDVGDALLQEVGARTREHLRVGDFCGRWGGDEFVVCLEDFGGTSNAAAAAQKLLLVLTDKYIVNESEVFVTPSIGIATYPEAGEDAERLIKAADVAMYEAKKRGGGRFQYYTEGLNARLEQREELEVGLRHALVRREFVMHYQPRIDVSTNKLIGFEALLRWQHPRYGLLAPERFLNILQGSGLIHSAGIWTIETASRQLASWQRQFEMPDLTVSINISSDQLKHGKLVGAVQKALADTTIDPGCLELEITNSKIIADREEQRETLQQLQALGVRLSLDHFGVSEMSFESLENSYIDSCVLDQSLIADVDSNGRHQRIVRAAIAMAQGLDIEVAAGGVETAAQLAFLKSCNCDSAQGYLISQPVDVRQAATLLRGAASGGRVFAA